MTVLEASSYPSADIATIKQDVYEIDGHIHNRERWLSKLAVPTGGKVAAIGLTPFQVDSGNNTWGVEVLVLDVNDTPQIMGHTKFDFHRLFITDIQRTSPYRIRILYGDTTAAAAELIGNYTDVMFRANATNSDRMPLEMIIPRLAIGTKVWVKVWNSDASGTLDFYLGLHEYLV